MGPPPRAGGGGAGERRRTRESRRSSRAQVKAAVRARGYDLAGGHGLAVFDLPCEKESAGPRVCAHTRGSASKGRRGRSMDEEKRMCGARAGRQRRLGRGARRPPRADDDERRGDAVRKCILEAPAPRESDRIFCVRPIFRTRKRPRVTRQTRKHSKHNSTQEDSHSLKVSRDTTDFVAESSKPPQPRATLVAHRRAPARFHTAAGSPAASAPCATPHCRRLPARRHLTGRAARPSSGRRSRG